MEKVTKGHGNGHAWIVGIIGLTASIWFFIKMPDFKVLTSSILIITLAHLLSGVVMLTSVYLVTPYRWMKKVFRKRETNALYFGWSYGWMNLFGLYFLGCVLAAIFIYLVHPGLVWLSFLILLLSFQLFTGFINLNRSKSNDYLTLPFVDLLSSDHDLILDAGCGGGRTTITLSRVMKNSEIVALDRFDSNYIDQGGMTILERNLALEGISNKVKIVQGDITNLAFKDDYFNTAISSYMIDHLVKNKLTALKEIERVLKPGGKFLLIIFVPNWFTFSIFNVFCTVLSSRKNWRELFSLADLNLKEEGAINGGIYFLLQKNQH